MGTPTAVRFSPLSLAWDDVLARLDPVFQVRELELRGVSRLGWNGDRFECIGQDFACETEPEALEQIAAKKWDGFVFYYLVPEVWTDLWLNIWRRGERTCVSMDVTGQLLHFDSEGYEQGEYLEKLMISVTSALEPAVCGYGTLHTELFEPIEEAALLELLENGALLQARSPSFHMFARSFVGEDTVARALESHPKNKKLRHYVTTSGYDVLSELP